MADVSGGNWRITVEAALRRPRALRALPQSPEQGAELAAVREVLPAQTPPLPPALRVCVEGCSLLLQDAAAEAAGEGQVGGTAITPVASVRGGSGDGLTRTFSGLYPIESMTLEFTSEAVAANFELRVLAAARRAAWDAWRVAEEASLTEPCTACADGEFLVNVGAGRGVIARTQALCVAPSVAQAEVLRPFEATLLPFQVALAGPRQVRLIVGRRGQLQSLPLRGDALAEHLALQGQTLLWSGGSEADLQARGPLPQRFALRSEGEAQAFRRFILAAAAGDAAAQAEAAERIVGIGINAPPEDPDEVLRQQLRLELAGARASFAQEERRLEALYYRLLDQDRNWADNLKESVTTRLIR